MSKRTIKGWVQVDDDIDESFDWEEVWYPDGHTGPRNFQLCLDVEGVFKDQVDMPGMEFSRNAKEVTITIEYDD